MVDKGLESERQLAAEVEAAREAPNDHWEEDPAPIKVKSVGSEVISFRLPSEELDRLEEAASAAGETMSQFVRGAITLRLEGGGQAAPSVDRVEAGAIRLTIRSAYAGSSTRIGESYFEGVPDFAPTTVQGALSYEDD